MQQPTIAERLSDGDRRAMGAADAVASDVLRHNDRFAELFEAMLHDDAAVRVRAAEATEKLTRARPDLLVPFRKRLIDEVGEVAEREVRRYVAQMLPRVRLDVKDKSRAIALLERYLGADDEMVAGAAMGALGDYAFDDYRLRRRFTPLIQKIAVSGSEPMQARAKKVLIRLASADKSHGLRR